MSQIVSNFVLKDRKIHLGSKMDSSRFVFTAKCLKFLSKMANIFAPCYVGHVFARGIKMTPGDEKLSSFVLFM